MDDDVHQRGGQFARGEDLSLRDRLIPLAVWAKGKVVCHASGFNAGQCCDAG
jgi:hypothetical protein